jgi:hypothetical protein
MSEEPGLDREELEAEEGDVLPEREAMSLIAPDGGPLVVDPALDLEPPPDHRHFP